jgi:hypothetical protein
MALPIGLKNLGPSATPMNFSQFLLLPIAEPRPVVRVTAPGQHEVVAELPCTLGEHVRVQDARRATVLSEERDRVDVYEWAVGTLSKSKSVSLPADMYATDAVLKGSVLFVSGGYRWPTESTEVLLARRLDGDEWFQPEIPKHILRPGKLIDALLVDGDRLIAVDDKIQPKWFLEYNVKSPERPHLMRAPELPQEPGELIHGAVLGNRFVALRSTAHADGRLSRYVRLYDRETLVECAYTSADHPLAAKSYREVSDPLGRRTLASNFEWQDFAFVGDTLLIAGGRDGLGVLDTRAVKTLKPVGPQLRRPAPAFLSQDEQLIFGAPGAGRETVAIVPVPAHQGAYVVEAGGTERFARWWSKA